MNTNQDFRLSPTPCTFALTCNASSDRTGFGRHRGWKPCFPAPLRSQSDFQNEQFLRGLSRRSGRRICLECGAATTKNGGRRRENISTPDCWSSCRLFQIWHDRMGELEKATDLPARVKAEIEQFFLSATLFTDKQAKVTGWSGPNAAYKLINASLTSRNT
jgi:hypothetical protein